MDKGIVRVMAVVADGQRILIINTRKRQGRDIMWTLPGGKAEENEKVMAVIKRELREEAGIGIEDRFDFLWERPVKMPDGNAVREFCFRVWPKTTEVKLEAGRKDFRWVTMDELDQYEMVGDLKERIKENSWKWLERPGE